MSCIDSEVNCNVTSLVVEPFVKNIQQQLSGDSYNIHLSLDEHPGVLIFAFGQQLNVSEDSQKYILTDEYPSYELIKSNTGCYKVGTILVVDHIGGIINLTSPLENTDNWYHTIVDKPENFISFRYDILLIDSITEPLVSTISSHNSIYLSVTNEYSYDNRYLSRTSVIGSSTQDNPIYPRTIHCNGYSGDYPSVTIDITKDEVQEPEPSVSVDDININIFLANQNEEVIVSPSVGCCFHFSRCLFNTVTCLIPKKNLSSIEPIDIMNESCELP